MKMIYIAMIGLIPAGHSFIYSQTDESTTPSANHRRLTREERIENSPVEIPYGELKELLRTATLSEKKTPKPPISAVLESVEFKLNLSGARPAMTASFEAKTFTADWNMLDLFGGSLRLEKSDDSVSVVSRDGTYRLLTNTVGEHTALLDLTVPAIEDWGAKQGFLFSPAPANRIVFSVSGIPEGKVVRLGDLRPFSSENGSQTWRLSGEEADLQVSLEEEAPENPILPSKWTLHTQMMIRYSDGRLKHVARVEARAESGSGVEMDLLLPPNASRIDLEGEELEDWKPGPRSDDFRIVRILWKTPNIFDRSFVVSWEIPQSALAGQWTISPPRVRRDDESESKTLVAMLPIDGLELTHPEVKTSEESSRLPDWLRNEVDSKDCLIAELAGYDPINLNASWLPRLKTAQATVSLAKFTTRLVTDGSMLVKADYTIQHSSPLTWLLELPSSDQILTCEVNQKDARPIQREANQIEFRLTSPQSDSGSTIHLCYALKSDALDPVSGQVLLELPRTDLFIHRIDWELVIPDDLEPAAVQGNVQLANDQTKTSETDESENLIRLEKELCRGERPAVELYYQRRDLTTDS